MSETKTTLPESSVAVRYCGRLEQIGIYLGKFMRMLVYQSDWKVLPMAAFIAGLVGMVISGSMFLGMEGTLMGAFALVMVCIWNGCFNSIQVICRERTIIKREHRSGMHISAYVIAHMLYQALLCLLQTGIILYVTVQMGVRYDLCQPLFTPWFLLDFGISLFLITFAADMMALWISTLARNTTTAMTVMPFVLIFQLVFSNAMFTLPDWSKPLTQITVSGQGVNVIAAQSDYNHRPLAAIWNYVQSMGNTEIGGKVTMEQAMDFLQKDTPLAREIRETEIRTAITVGDVLHYLQDDSKPEVQQLRGIVLSEVITREQASDILSDSLQSMVDEHKLSRAEAILVKGFVESSGLLDQFTAEGADSGPTLGELLDSAAEHGVFDEYMDQEIELKTTVGELVTFIQNDTGSQELREKSFTVKATIAELQSMIGVEKVRVLLQEKAAQGSVKPSYEYTRENVSSCWLKLVLFSLCFAALATITLEFIDKDKR